MITSGVVVAYHGCDREVGERVLSGATEIQPSNNDYDWLGSGAYFWEGSAQRALEWSRFLQRRPSGSREKIREPFVVGAIILSGICLDLAEADSLKILGEVHVHYARVIAATGLPQPKNLPGSTDDDDLVKRHLDCAVFNFLHEYRTGSGEPAFDTIRCPFFEGKPVFPGSKIAALTHIQWCVRNPRKNVLGYFRVRRERETPC